MAKLEFDLSVKGMSLLNASILVDAAGWVYEDLNQLGDGLRRDCGITKYAQFDNQDTQAFLAADDSMLLLVFRGTTTGRDWRTDCKVGWVASKYGRIHYGFSKALDYVWSGLRQAVLDFRDRNQTIWITGHSLGGALATLAADRLSEEAVRIEGLYTFGQPRVGDKIFARNFSSKLEKRTFRFVHDEDAVTKVPLFLQGYYHIGTECYFDRDGKLYTEGIRWHRFLSRCASMTIRCSKEASKYSAQNPGGLRDHGLGFYKRRIMENLIKDKGGAKTFKEYINY